MLARTQQRTDGAKTSLRERFSLFRSQVQTALGLPRGFFVQVDYMKSINPVDSPYPEIERLCETSPYPDFLAAIDAHREVFQSFGQAPGDPVLARGMLSALDGMATYAAVRMLKPRRIVEVGSGNSTFFLARAVKDNGFGRVTCIDPAPRHDIAALDVDFHRRVLSPADADFLGELNANDILFIDSSHVMLPGLDVDILFNRVFPRLKPGVAVHVHDIFLPDDYPPHWQLRNWSEQNALVGWIISGWFDILWPGQYVLTRQRHLLDRAAEIAPIIGAGSIWLQRPNPNP